MYTYWQAPPPSLSQRYLGKIGEVAALEILEKLEVISPLIYTSFLTNLSFTCTGLFPGKMFTLYTYCTCPSLFLISFTLSGTFDFHLKFG